MLEDEQMFRQTLLMLEDQQMFQLILWVAEIEKGIG